MISDGVNTLLSVGLNEDVLQAEIACYEQFKDQPKKIVENIQYGLTTDEKCEAIFDYLTRRVVYQLDKIGDQYIKSPARLLNDGRGDCKSLAMFINCCLHCLGIPHIFRFVSFDGGSQYTHVYAVAIDERGNEIVLDPCEKDENGIILYGYARPYKKKKDFRYDR